MTQFNHTLVALLSGKKTETSRIIRPGEYTWICGEMPAPWLDPVMVREVFIYSGISSTRQEGEKFTAYYVWQRGKDYAIQPGRGVKSVGRFVVEQIWRQDVRTLTLGQVEAEGFGAALWVGFWETWCKMHDKPAVADIQHIRALTGSQLDAKSYLMKRPAERYQAWRMTIRVLWPTVDWDAPVVRALQIDKSSLY